jgi:Mrp family chromosome partitioning ATPase/capsular polysaccharide biosynthesis protein
MNNLSPLAAIRRRWWIVAGCAVLGALLGGLPQPETVEEQATSFVATHTMLANDGGDTAIISPSQVILLTTAGEVPARVAETLGFSDNSAELAAQINVLFDFETSALTISTIQATAEQAEAVADSFADELNTYLAERQDSVYEDRVTASRKRLEELESSLNELTRLLALSPTDAVLLAERDAVSRQYGFAFEQNGTLEQSPDTLTFTTLERAQAIPEVDRGLSAPTSRSTRAVMGLVVGTTLGAALAILLGRLDRKIRSREQAEELMAMRARVAIPKVRHSEAGTVVSSGRHDPLSDAYRTVRNVVGFVQNGLDDVDRAWITLVVSPGPGDGKTSLAANLAAAFVEVGEKTIAVNTDFRRPRLYNAMMGTPTPLLDVDIAQLDALPRKALPLGIGGDKLKILDLSTVDASPGDLTRATMGQVKRLRSGTDQIVIDTSPVGATAEVLELVPYADVIVIVEKVGHTYIEATERTIALLRDIATAPLVFVIGGIKVERNPYYEYTDRRRGRKRVDPAVDPADTETHAVQASE